MVTVCLSTRKADGAASSSLTVRRLGERLPDAELLHHGAKRPGDLVDIDAEGLRRMRRLWLSVCRALTSLM